MGVDRYRADGALTDARCCDTLRAPCRATPFGISCSFFVVSPRFDDLGYEENA
jgi:hypothetical protein